MATQKEILRRLLMAQTAQTIMKELKLSPSRLKRILDSPRMVTTLALQQRVAKASVALHSAMVAPDAPSRLHEIAFGEHGEIGRRACLSMLRLQDQINSPQAALPNADK